MKQTLTAFLILLLLIGVISASAQEMPENYQVRCPDGTEINNGVEFVISVRANFVYTVTAVGLGDFDPVIAVKDRGFVRSCSDNNPRTADFQASLPSTGRIAGGTTSAQTRFSHAYEGLEPISIIIGDENGDVGEFLMTLEGLVITPSDTVGDTIELMMSRNIAYSPRNAVAYMIALDGRLDPLLQQIDANAEVLLSCDDAGTTSFCEDPYTASLSGSFITPRVNEQTPSRDFNAMLDLRTSGVDDPSPIRLLMTSYDPNTRGGYILAFHVGIGDENTIVEVAPTDTETLVVRNENGVSVDCPGTSNIENGIEVTITVPVKVEIVATALGVDGFDPIMAVVNEDQLIECVDDSPSANSFTATLPSTEMISSSTLHPQLQFGDKQADLLTYSLIVGGFDGADGEFLLLIESVITEGTTTDVLISKTSNLELTPERSSIYMFALASDLDPLIRQVNSSNEILVVCNNAGQAGQCPSNIPSLADSVVSLGELGESYSSDNNALLFISELQRSDDKIRFQLSGTNNTSGMYIIGLHLGISSAGG